MQKLNKRDIIEQVSEKAHVSKKDAENAIEVAFDLMEKALLEGREVNITNFGAFTPKTRKQRDGTDPKKHTRITIKQARSVSFRLSKSFKAKLNK
ncbi:MAG: HU family DNA-binding protein [Bacilli bacterium]|nr:HU family DNA-binding protein [Bacilli bacterium]